MVGVARGHQRADTLKPYSQKNSQSNHTRTTALSNSMKLSHAYGATKDRWVMVERSDRMWSTGEENGNPLQYSCLENPMDGGAWRATVRGVTKSQTRLSIKHFHFVGSKPNYPCRLRHLRSPSSLPLACHFRPERAT